MRPDRRQSGYSLIEVLVAFTILAMTLTVLFRIFSGGLRNVDTSAEYSLALLVAEELLTAPGHVERVRQGVTEGTSSGGYRWTRTISEIAAEGYESVRDSGVLAYRIEVAVTWDAGLRERRIDLATVRLQRPEKPAVARR